MKHNADVLEAIANTPPVRLSKVTDGLTLLAKASIAIQAAA